MGLLEPRTFEVRPFEGAGEQSVRCPQFRHETSFRVRDAAPPTILRRALKILLWHGYLLGGTGSNVYTRALAREWSRAGHEVVVFCQERHPELYDIGGAEVVRPELPGGLLPVFVLDRYEGLEAARLQDLTPPQRSAYVDANAA